MTRAVFAVICLTVLMIISGCSGSGAPSGAVMTLTPSDKPIKCLKTLLSARCDIDCYGFG